jgi:hypothetical protein
MKKTDKPVYYTAMTILVEMEIEANSQEEANGILRRKMQMLASSNADLAVNEMVSKFPTKDDLPLRGFDLNPIP